MTEQEYFDQRLEDQMAFFSKKSTDNKTKYFRFKVIVIILSASLPFVVKYSTIPGFPEIIGLIGVIISILSGLDALFNYHEHWVNYRKVQEVLKREKFLYLTKSGPYQEETTFQQFVANVETIIASENNEWFSLNKNQPSQSNTSNPEKPPVSEE
jgi:hypothetical protein